MVSGLQMKKVTITLEDKDVDELEVLLYSEYDACTVNNHGQITLYSQKACKHILPSTFMNTSGSSCFDCSTERDMLGVQKVTGNRQSLAHREHRYVKGQIVWAKSSINCPYWPSYVLDIKKQNVHLHYISRSKFAKHAGHVVIGKSKLIPYSPATDTTIMNDGLRYYKRLQLWDYMSDFHNAVLLAKTYISFQKRGFFTSQHQIYQFFNSDLPQTEPKDSHTPLGCNKKKPSRKRSRSVLQEDGLNAPKRNKAETVQSLNACEGSAFQQKVYHHVVTGECREHIQRILEGDVACERMKAIQKGMSKSRLRSWREIYINPYFHIDQHCDNVLKELRDILYNHQKRIGSKYPFPKFFCLLYDVLYPEVIIEGIRKLGRLGYHDADMTYRSTVVPVDENDKSFDKVLSKRERKLMQNRLTSFAVGLRL